MLLVVIECIRSFFFYRWNKNEFVIRKFEKHSRVDHKPFMAGKRIPWINSVTSTSKPYKSGGHTRSHEIIGPPGHRVSCLWLIHDFRSSTERTTVIHPRGTLQAHFDELSATCNEHSRFLPAFHQFSIYLCPQISL